MFQYLSYQSIILLPRALNGLTIFTIFFIIILNFPNDYS